MSDHYNPSLDRFKGKEKTTSAYRRSRKQETEVAERFGGRKTAASGSRFHKGDSEVPDIARIENKATQADSFRVTKAMLDTVEQAGRLHGQIPVIDIEFVDDRENPLYACCVMKRRDLENLIRRLADAEGSKPATGKRGVRRLKHHQRKLTPSA